MIGLIILILLVVAFYVGGRRGAPLQISYSVGYLIAFIVACSKYQGLAKKLELYIPYLSVTQDSKLVFYTMNRQWIWTSPIMLLLLLSSFYLLVG